MSHEYDISTQRRHSNNASRYHEIELEESDSVPLNPQYPYHQTSKDRRSPTLLRGNQRQAGVTGKRS